MQLRRPDKGDKETILEMMVEFEENNSPHDGGFWDKESFDYDNWLKRNFDNEIGIELPENWVPSIQFVAFDDNGMALGFLSLRLRLTDHLLEVGGHIGYSVRPSQRNKGIAKQMLTEGIKVARQKNIQEILVTCHENNPASRAVIMANFGRLEDTRNHVERYWITKK
ncbi:GNAT family N-acetyltransferase [Streptococcus hongkongensis]|nr:GNAT family acetyltransferase [Streptococcus uberis]